MEELSNGKLENLGDAWNEEDDAKDVRSSESADNANSYPLDETLLDEFRKAKKPRGRVSAVPSVTACDTSPIKKSSSYTVAASPIQQLALMTGESPSKNRERDEKIRVLREKKMMEQKKKEEELKDSIARAEEVRKRQEEERRRKVEEQRRREEEHRALVEERRRRLWDEEFERRQSIIKRTAEREARIDFKKPFKSANLVQLSGNQQYQILQSLNYPENAGRDRAHGGHFDAKNPIYKVAKLARSDITSLSKMSDDRDLHSGSSKYARDSKTYRPGNAKATQNPHQRNKSTMFNSMHQLSQGNSMRGSSVSRNEPSIKSKSFGSGLDKNVPLKPKVVTSKSALGFEKGAPPVFLLTLGLSKSCGHSDGTLSSGTARTQARSLFSPSSISTVPVEDGGNDKSNRTPRPNVRVHRSREKTRRSAPPAEELYERPLSMAPSYCSATISFRIRAGRAADDGPNAGEWSSCICPRFRSSSPSKSRARSMGNMQRAKVEINSGSIASKSTIIHTNQKEKGFIIAAKPATKPREKTPARVKPATAPPPAPTSYQQQAAFERLRSRRSKTPVVLGSALTEVKHSDDAPKPVLNSGRDSLMIKSLDSGTLAKNLKKMRSSWAPVPLKEKQEKPKQTAMKAVPKKVTAPPQKPTTLPEKLVEVEASNPEEVQLVAVEQEIVMVKDDDDSKKNDSASSNPTSHASTPTPTSEGAAGGSSKKLSQMEEHQKKLAENRRLARERAEQKAEEERIRLEKLRIEEEERQRREEEEARRQEEEELRMLEEAKKIEHERYLKAVEEEMVRRKQEEERQEAERKEKLEAELKAQEEAEKREREREEKMKKMAEEKEERKKKLEMIMKRVKAEEPISKIDPVTSPINEDASLSVTTNITSQPSSSNSDPSKNSFEAVRNEVDTSPNFKSPLLQKMLGKKLKGNVHPCPVKSVGDVESWTKSSEDVCSPEEAANDRSENKASSPDVSSGDISPVEVLQSPFTNPPSHLKGSGTAPSESAFQTLDGKGETADRKQKTTALVEESTVDACKTDSILFDVDTELSLRNDALIGDNKSQDPKHRQHVDVVVEDDIECVIESDENSPFLPNSLADEIPVAAVNDNNSSNNNISHAPHSNSSESSLESMFASVVTTRDAEDVQERGKLSETASDEDDSNCDSENSQELSVKPLNVLKHQEGEGLLNFNEEVSSSEGNKTLERESNQFSGWMADDSDVLSDIFTGSRLSAEGTGAGESLPKNFGITSTISD